jgi:hypothetical protein
MLYSFIGVGWMLKAKRGGGGGRAGWGRERADVIQAVAAGNPGSRLGR